jgi:glycosyltransferase involved in cell wall biosynthesis
MALVDGRAKEAHMRGLHIMGNPYHVAMVRSILEEDPECMRLVRELRGIYFIGGGMNPRKIETWLHVLFMNTTLHWIGSDVLDLLHTNFKHAASLRALVKAELRRFLLKQTFHLAGAPWLVKELRSVDITAKYVPLPVRLPEAKIKPLPKDPSILVYLPEGKEHFYGWKLIYAVAAVYPQIKWHVIAHSGRGLYASENIIFHGWLSRDSVLDLLGQSTALVRLTDHDGLSYSVLEALALGRYVIWTYNFPFCIQCDKTTQALELALNELLEHRYPNLEGSLYVREVFDPRRVALQLLRALRERER